MSSTTYTVYHRGGGSVVARGLTREQAGDTILGYDVQRWEARPRMIEEWSEEAGEMVERQDGRWWECWRIPHRRPPFRCVDLIALADTKEEAEAQMASDALRFDYWELDAMPDAEWDRIEAENAAADA